MLEYRIETWDENLIEELKPLTERHYQEVALHKAHIPLKPDWTRYTKLADMNALLVIGVRDAGKLVGYSVFFISSMMHYMTTLSASNDVIYLAPEYRNGFAGVKLIKASEAALKERGITKVLWHVKFAKDFRKILYRMGYCDEDAVVGKIIKD
jgi:GNAT superfamily N-acetyltransferase